MNDPTPQQDPPPRRLGLLAALGPGILVAATGVGAGDIAGAGFAGSRLGYAILWAALLGAFIKFVVNEGLTRFQLASGQTLLEGMVSRFGVFFHAFFGVYLILWSLGVGLSLISASGVALHSLLPLFPDAKTGRNVWGIAQSLIAVLVILFGSFKTFEKLMTALLVMMFASVVAAAAMFDHPWGEVIKGLAIPRIPRSAGPEGVRWTLALMGGVGGTLTVLCYGYWIRESGRNSPDDLRLCRLDLAFAYTGTGLFGVAMAMLACNMSLGEAGGEMMMLAIAEKLAGILGWPFKYVFLLGAWAAVITSLLGVWQAVPYLFADFYTQVRRYHAKDPTAGPSPIGRTSPPYLLYLLFLALVPMLGLRFSFERIQQAQAMLGAIVMPMLAAALLILNSNPALVGDRYRNRLTTILVLIGVLAFFAYAGYLTIATLGRKSILS